MNPTLVHWIEALGITFGIYLIGLFLLTYWRDIRGAVVLHYCPECEKEGRGKIALTFDRGYGRLECKKCHYHE